MKIAIDASDIDRDGAGIGYVIKGLITGFQAFPEHDYLIYIRDDREFELPENFSVIKIPARSKLLGGGYAWYYNLARELTHREADILISPTLNSASQFFPKTLQIIHDLTPVTDGRFYTWTHRTQFRVLLSNIVAKAKWLVAISEATKASLLELYPGITQEVAVIPLGINSWAFVLQDYERNKAIAEKYDLPEKYLLSVGTVQPRKNYENIIAAFALFAEDHPDYHYVIVGRKGWMTGQIEKAVAKHGLTDKVRFLGYVPEEDLPFIYDQARAFINASFNEGFGLPILEALLRKVPILTSNLPVYRELVTGSNAVFSDPSSVTELAKSIQEVIELENPEVASDFFSKYSWENSARVILQHIASS